MDRVEFTENIVSLLHEMILMGEHPIIDFVKRSDQEQRRLFDAGLSKCDGVKNVSKHQTGSAMDIYFVGEGGLEDPRMGFNHWHATWESFGGKKMIEWDKNHFEKGGDTK
jgi:hypothetical protein